MKIVNLRTRDAGVTLRYRCDGLSLALGDAVMIDTELCEEIAFVAQEPYVEETSEDIPFVKRMASEKELEKYYDICAKDAVNGYALRRMARHLNHRRILPWHP